MNLKCILNFSAERYSRSLEKPKSLFDSKKSYVTYSCVQIYLWHLSLDPVSSFLNTMKQSTYSTKQIFLSFWSAAREINFRSSIIVLKVLLKMWDVIDSQENRKFPYNPLLHQDICAGNSDQQFTAKELLTLMESNVSPSFLWKWYRKLTKITCPSSSIFTP